MGALLVVVFLGAPTGSAVPANPSGPAPDVIRLVVQFDFHSVGALGPKTPSASQTPSTRPPRSTRRQIVGGVLGAAAGLMAGGLVGYTIAGDCACDDPGLSGIVIGAPIGALVGAFLGARVF